MGGFRSRSTSGDKNSGDKNSGDKRASSQGGGRGHADRRRGGGQSGYRRKSESHRQEREDARDTRGSGDVVRDLVLSVLQQVSSGDAYANLVLPKALTRAKMSGRDAAFATELTYGTLRAQGLLDAVIAEAAGRPVSRIDETVLDVLRLGTYQILRTRVDDHAAVNTSVELVKANGEEKAAGFTNGVLRSITRTPAKKWLAKITADLGDPVEEIALQHSHPRWIAGVFNTALGGTEQTPAADLEEALDADDARPLVHLAARPGQMSGEELALVTGGDEGKWSPYAVYLSEGNPGSLPPVQDGLASVQDEGSQLIALAVTRAQVDDDAGRWLDLCSGPGGKTAFIAAWGSGDGVTVDAVEPAEHRADLVRKATDGLPVRVHVGDGREPRSVDGLDVPADGFDRVLVDAPCTGLGALRRRPEARWRKTADDVPPLVSLQRDLLRAALSVTKPGGVVVYSTCSPHPAETVEVARSVAEETGAVIEDATALFPELAGAGLDSAPFVQLWPHRHGTDAMFFAVLRKA